MAFGIDHASSPPHPALLKEKGVRFVCRYLSTAGNPKNISRGEADALKLARIGIVLVFETTADRALAGYAAGDLDARNANLQANLVGLPGAPVYFAVDFDALAAQQHQISAYFDGAAAAIGKARVGGYGGYYVIRRLFDAGKIRYGWQTYAWSGGQWDRRAHIRQYHNGVRFCGIDCDFDRSTRTDYGQAKPPVIRKVSAGVRRRRLRAWVRARRAAHVPWRVLKRTADWKLWRRLGGH